MVKTLVSYFVSDDRYNDLLDVSVNSFHYFHKNENYELIVCNQQKLSILNINQEQPFGIVKFECAYKLAKLFDADKVIILGADTIICSRLDEFFDDSQTDILATLDYPYKIPFDFVNSTDENHINADVICFNNLDSLQKIIQLSKKDIYLCSVGYYFEQGALNDFVFSGNYSCTSKIVDYPYSTSKVVYNVRSKGNRTLSELFDPIIINACNNYFVDDDKLYSFDKKQIKVFHYGTGFGTFSEEKFKEVLAWYADKCFNEQTKTFFKKISGSNMFNLESCL